MAELADFTETIDLAFEARELPADERCEPPAASTVRQADTIEVAPLDPTRTEFDLNPKPPRRRALGGPIGSLLFHLLPLLALITWLRPPLPIPPPIPIQLVVEQPPPPPPAPAPAPPKPEPKPPSPGLRASDDMGEVGPPKPEKGSDTAPPTKGEPQPPAPATEAKPTVSPSAPPAEPTQIAEAPPPLVPKPAPPKREAAVRLPKPDGLLLPLPISPDQHTALRSARLPGPNATRDEYCAYALTLALQHLNLLPLSLLGARHGDTAVAILLRSDGSISSVRVVRGSDYDDIDERVVQMVWAVGRFPPLPAWVPGPMAEFTFHLHFPHPSQR